MATAPYRITLWQAKKKGQLLTRFVTVDNVDGAVSVACQWVCWSNSEGRGKRAKFDMWRVETQVGQGVWRTTTEGDLADAKAYRQEAKNDEPEKGARPVYRGGRRDAVRIFGEPKRSRRGRPKTRLAELVAQIKAGQ